jgi:hypothetical protein
VAGFALATSDRTGPFLSVVCTLLCAVLMISYVRPESYDFTVRCSPRSDIAWTSEGLGLSCVATEDDSTVEIPFVFCARKTDTTTEGSAIADRRSASYLIVEWI